MTSTKTATAAITLPDGTWFARRYVRVPKSWKSALLHRLPYGTSALGAVFSLAADCCADYLADDGCPYHGTAPVWLRP